MTETTQQQHPPKPPEDNHHRFAIRRPVSVAMLFLTLLVFGWRSYQELPLNLMPDISYPTLTVRTEYENAAPEDVEKLVTRPLEERLSIVTGVVEISSISSAGLSEVILEFTWGTDMNTALQDVRESLDLFDPPQGISKRPVILRFDPTLDPVMRVSLTGPDFAETVDQNERADLVTAELMLLREAAENYIKSDLEAEEGIAQVLVKGGREEEVQILVDSERLKTLGLTPADVASSLQAQNINLSGGRLKEGKAEYLVRTLNEFQDIAEIRAAVIRAYPSSNTLLPTKSSGASTSETRNLRLGDIALVRSGQKERETIVRVNGQEAIELEFYKEGDANIVQVCETLKDFFNFERKVSIGERAAIFLGTYFPSERTRKAAERYERRRQVRDQLRTRLPKQATAMLVTDQSRFIVASIKEVQTTALLGGLLALLILYVFLREVKSTLIIGVAIPISIIATFIPMFMGGVSLNIMSLGGLALGVGMLVDNSVVVLESIFRCVEEGDNPTDAADRGTREVASAVTASTLTTIAVFFPMVFVEGIAGQLFRDLALTVTFSLSASLLVALYLIPMIASRQGLDLAQSGHAIWVMRAYRETQQEAGGRRAGAIASIPTQGWRYGRQWIAATWGETIGLVWGHMKKVTHVDAVEVSRGLMARSAWALLLLPVCVLFLLQSALKIVTTLFVTLLFIASLGLLVIVWIAGYFLRIILWLPITIFDYSFRAVRDAYTILLKGTLQFSTIILLLVLAITVHAGQIAFQLGRELIPPMRQAEFGIRLESPPGTRLEDTDKKAQGIERIASANPYVESVTLQVGTDDSSVAGNEGENIANLTVKLRNPEESAAIQDDIIESLRLDIVERIPEPVTFTLPTLFSFKTAVELQIFGDDLEELRRLGGDVIDLISDIEGLKDAKLSLEKGYPEVHIVLDRALLATKGLTPYQVAQALRTEIQGDVATRLSRAGEKIDIRVRSDQRRLSSLQDLYNLSVTDGVPPTPLSAVAEITTADGPSQIRRIDQRRVAVIAANVEGYDIGSVNDEIEDRLTALEWPEGYSYALGGQNRELETSYGGLLFALALAIFLVYVVMASQFESIWHPALIMFSVPLAFIGVVYVLQWLGISLSIVVFIGGIVLAGIVVNDAIVLVDYINQLRQRGHTKMDAVIEAGKVRFRPIMMTTLTTVLGLIPMAISTGEGAEVRQPMAITVMAGLSSATILTLIIIPMIYYLFGGRDKSPEAEADA